MADQSTSSQATAQEGPKGGSRALILVAGAVVLAITFVIVWLQSSKYEPLVVGKEAPDFALTDLNEKPYRLSVAPSSVRAAGGVPVVEQAAITRPHVATASVAASREDGGRTETAVIDLSNARERRRFDQPSPFGNPRAQ